MRTTINLDDALLERVKREALRSHRTMTAVIEDSLRTTLSRPEAPVVRRRVKLHTFRGQGLRPGLDVDDTAALMDALDPPHVVA